MRHILLILLLSGSGLTSPLIFGVFGFPGAPETDPWGVNNSGVIAGNYSIGTGGHGFVRSADGQSYTSIDFPGQSVYSTTVVGINNVGDVLGTFFDGFHSHPFIRSVNGDYTSFDVPGTPTFPVSGINSSGQVVGSASSRGFIRNSAGVYTFFDVPGQEGNCCAIPGPGINDSGEVVGTVNDRGHFHGFIRSADGRQYTLFDPPGLFGSVASAINDKGEVAGFGFSPDGRSELFIRSADGNTYTFADLPFFPEGIIEARGINDNEEVVGSFGLHGLGVAFCTGPCTGSILATPEVTSMSMTVSGLVTFLLINNFKWRRRRRFLAER